MSNFRIKLFLSLFFINILPTISQLNKTNILECQEGGIKCDLNHGKCQKNPDHNNEYYCECNKGYITYPEDNEIKCNYKKKSQLIPFLLEIIFCCGFGHLYFGKYIPALIKFFGCVLMLYLYSNYSINKEKLSTVVIVITSVNFIGILLFQIYDIFNFGKNQ